MTDDLSDEKKLLTTIHDGHDDHAPLGLGDELGALRRIQVHLLGDVAADELFRSVVAQNFCEAGFASRIFRPIGLIVRDTRANRRKTAEVLDIGERTLYRKLRDYGIAPEELAVR